MILFGFALPCQHFTLMAFTYDCNLMVFDRDHSREDLVMEGEKKKPNHQQRLKEQL